MNNTVKLNSLCTAIPVVGVQRPSYKMPVRRRLRAVVPLPRARRLLARMRFAYLDKCHVGKGCDFHNRSCVLVAAQIQRDPVLMFTHMKNLLASLSLGRTPDLRLNLSVAIGSTVIRQVAASGLYFIAMWITTRQLGPHQNGVLATALLLPQSLYAFLNFGLGPSHVYHLSSGAGNLRSMRTANWSLALSLWIAVVIAISISSDATIAKYLPGIAKSSALYASVLFPLMLLAAWSSSLIQGHRDYQAYNKTLMIQPFVFCVAVIGLYAANA
ncbi:MAG: hypothetical protein ABWY27_05085, partial [Telluria sp.]